MEEKAEVEAKERMEIEKVEKEKVRNALRFVGYKQ